MQHPTCRGSVDARQNFATSVNSVKIIDLNLTAIRFSTLRNGDSRMPGCKQDPKTKACKMWDSENPQNTNAPVDVNSWVDPLRDEQPKVATPQIWMEEEFTLSTGQALKRAVLNALWMPVVLAALFGGIGLVMSIGFALAGFLPKHPLLIQIAILPVMLFAAGWVLTFVIWAPVSLLGCPFTKHRRISLIDGTLIQKTSCRTTKLSLDDCSWLITDRAGDTLGRYFGFGQLVEIRSDEQRIVCGFSEVKRQEWVEVLTTAGAQPVIAIEQRKAWLYGAAISLSSGGLGGLLGYVLYVFSNNQFWIASSSIIGFLDGAILSLGLFYWARQGESKAASKVGPAWCTLMFLVTGVKFSVGLQEKLITGLVNAGVGWLCGRYITSKAKSLHKESSSEIGDE